MWQRQTYGSDGAGSRSVAIGIASSKRNEMVQAIVREMHGFRALREADRLDEIHVAREEQDAPSLCSLGGTY